MVKRHSNMSEDEIRQMIEQIDPEGDISDAKKEELVLIMKERFLATDDEPKKPLVPTIEPVFAPDDWRGRAAHIASKISQGLDS